MVRGMVAGGTQSSSTMPRTKRRVPGSDDVVDWFSPTHPDSPEAPNLDMSITVGWNAAVKANLTREEIDARAQTSHHRAVAAIDHGNLTHATMPTESEGRGRGRAWRKARGG